MSALRYIFWLGADPADADPIMSRDELDRRIDSLGDEPRLVITEHDMAELRGSGVPLRDVTEDIVRESVERGLLDAHSALANAHGCGRPSPEDIGDYRYHQMRDDADYRRRSGE